MPSGRKQRKRNKEAFAELFHLLKRALDMRLWSVWIRNYLKFERYLGARLARGDWGEFNHLIRGYTVKQTLYGMTTVFVKIFEDCMNRLDWKTLRQALPVAVAWGEGPPEDAEVWIARLRNKLAGMEDVEWVSLDAFRPELKRYARLSARSAEVRQPGLLIYSPRGVFQDYSWWFDMSLRFYRSRNIWKLSHIHFRQYQQAV